MDSEPLEDFSVYQGFSHGWDKLPWALDALVEMPAHVLEPMWPLEVARFV